MKTIALKYRPIKFIPWQFTAHGFQPEKWDEVSSKQIVAIACASRGVISDIDFLQTLSGLKKRVVKQLDDYQRFVLGNSLTFLNDKKMYNSIILQKITLGVHTYWAPKPKLKGMTFGQFIFVESHFGTYQATNDKNELHSFLAALYLRNRKKFNENDISNCAGIMSRLDSNAKEAIVLNYLLIKEWLTETYPLLFLKSEPSESTNDASRTKNYDSMAWVKIFENMVGDNLSQRNEYALLPVHTAFRYLSKRIKENIKKKK
jgi:hypothetical protein